MIKFDLFTRRVAARVLSASIFAALALLGFAATFQFAEEAGDFARLRDAAWSTALRLPQIAIFVLPLAALIGSAAAFRLLAAAARDARRARLRIFAARGGSDGGGGGGGFGGGAFFGGRIRFGAGRKRLAGFGRSGGARGARFWSRFVAARRRRLRARRAGRIRG